MPEVARAFIIPGLACDREIPAAGRLRPMRTASRAGLGQVARSFSIEYSQVFPGIQWGVSRGSAPSFSGAGADGECAPQVVDLARNCFRATV